MRGARRRPCRRPLPRSHPARSSSRGSSSQHDDAPGSSCRVRRHQSGYPPFSGRPGSVLAGGVGQQTLVDLAQRDREGLLLGSGVDQGADVLQQALGELAVVGVDLTRALGGEDDQAVLAAGALEQLVDRRVGDALGGRCDSGHGWACSSFDSGSERPAGTTGAALTRGHYSPGTRPGEGAVSKLTNSCAARPTSSLTTTTSNSPAASSSACARASRRSWTAGGSEPRPASRLTSSAHDGGARKTSCAFGSRARTWRAPCSSISSRAGDPVASRFRSGSTGVPYRLPAYSAHSSRPSSSISRSNSASSTKW